MSVDFPFSKSTHFPAHRFPLFCSLFITLSTPHSLLASDDNAGGHFLTLFASARHGGAGVFQMRNLWGWSRLSTSFCLVWLPEPNRTACRWDCLINFDFDEYDKLSTDQTNPVHTLLCLSRSRRVVMKNFFIAPPLNLTKPPVVLQWVHVAGCLHFRTVICLCKKHVKWRWYFSLSTLANSPLPWFTL